MWFITPTDAVHCHGNGVQVWMHVRVMWEVVHVCGKKLSHSHTTMVHHHDNLFPAHCIWGQSEHLTPLTSYWEVVLSSQLTCRPCTPTSSACSRSVSGGDWGGAVLLHSLSLLDSSAYLSPTPHLSHFEIPCELQLHRLLHASYTFIQKKCFCGTCSRANKTLVAHGPHERLNVVLCNCFTIWCHGNLAHVTRLFPACGCVTVLLARLLHHLCSRSGEELPSDCK